MKRLAILLDGTWNDQLDNTNVWRFKVMLAQRSTVGTEQRVFYQPGVGTHWYDRFRGGVFGQGLYQNVQAAYQWLLENYDPNDEVYIFGFSRGAYTARSLGGMITKCGLLAPGAPLSLSQIYGLYRLGDRLRPLYHLEFLKRTGIHNEPPFNREEELLLQCSSRIPIRMMGVWDTVGALGIPVGVFTGINRRDYGFLHTRLSNIFERTYQALAVDENRKEYDATLWTRFVPKVSDRPARSAAPRPEQIVEQRWFAGAHSNVGGGYPSDPLALLSLDWMRAKAEAAGLTFRSGVQLNGNEHLADVTDSFAKFLGGAYRLVRRRLYRGIQRAPVEKEKGRVETVNETIDPSVGRKWVADAKYRPKNLVEWEKRTGNRVADLSVALLVALLTSAFSGLLAVGPVHGMASLQGRRQVSDSAALQRAQLTGGRHPDTLYIRTAVPSVAQRGDTVAFQLSDSLPRSAHPVRVSIGGFVAPLVAVSASEIVVVVPSTLPSGDTVPRVTFYAGTVPTRGFHGLTVIRSPVGLWWPAGAAGLAVLLTIAVLVVRRMRRGPFGFIKPHSVAAMVTPPTSQRPAPPREVQATEAVAQPRHQLPQLPVPVVPESLVSAIVSGECGLFAGAGLSAQGGYPTWLPFVGKLLEWAIAEHYVDVAFGQSLRAALQQGGTASVADTIVSAVPAGSLLTYLQEVFATEAHDLPAVHRTLRGIEFCAAFTTNFDGLLERTFEGMSAQVLTPTAADVLRESLTKNRFFILKLYGTLERPDSVLVAPAQFRDAVSRNRSFSSFMDTVFLSRTLLFLGASLDGIQTYLDGLGIRVDSASNRPEGSSSRVPSQVQRTHYALVAVTDDAWRAQAEVLRRRYNIEVLPYTPDEGYTPLSGFVTSLGQLVDHARTVRMLGTPGIAPTRETSALKSVHLENIGPFEQLDLELHRNWNVLLGDNGVGKSTILKALGLALCGRDAQQYAGPLVRSGQNYGKIVLSTGRNSYLIELFQRDGQTEVDAHGRVFEAEGWLPLGFSPIRTVTREQPKGPTAMGQSLASSEDVLPLVRGDPDPRMNNVKQWLVNLDYYSAKDAADRAAAGGRYARLQEDFDATIKALVAPMQLEIKVKNAQRGSVVAITADGEVPIESLSQGTASLLGWIGVVIQRLYEVFGEDANPRDRYALVLLDEIDAHMHPAWQRALVSRLGRLFPNVQFIATTHSPLIVGGMPASQLFRFARDGSGKVVRVELDEDTAMGRSDQVLRGQLFDLPVTLDEETERVMAEYQAALANPDPKARGLQAKLEKQLAGRIPRSSDDRAERRAHELVEAVLQEQLLPTPEVTKLVSERAKKLLDAVAQSRSP